jgi:hypothetical protein
MKSRAVDAGVAQTSGQQFFVPQCPDNIESSFRLPVVSAVAALPFLSVSVAPGHVEGKPAFINVDDRISGFFMSSDRALKLGARYRIRLRVLERFFCVLPPAA